jgi:three-Cys-motif partner protein
MKIRLIINDGDVSCVDSVRAYIDDQNKDYCDVCYNILEASLMFEKVVKEVTSTAPNTRNLIFVDPYGYKDINKETLLNLLSNKRTEIILFLPISHMQRFTQKALESNESQYEPLKRFINSFFDDYHPIYDEKKTAQEYINYIKYALRFNCREYYSTSYSIQRDLGSYFALFFITAHVYGYEKILEVKWELDEMEGSGFNQPKAQQSLFMEEDKKDQQEANYKRLEYLLTQYLATPKTNQEVYLNVLHHEFLPKHATKIFKEWQQNNANFEVTDYMTGTPKRDGWFYVGWTYYKPPNTPKVRLHIKH